MTWKFLKIEKTGIEQTASHQISFEHLENGLHIDRKVEGEFGNMGSISVKKHDMLIW